MRICFHQYVSSKHASIMPDVRHQVDLRTSKPHAYMWVYIDLPQISQECMQHAQLQAIWPDLLI